MRQVFNGGKFLALADEEGFVSIVDTAAPLPRSTADDDEPKPRAQWLAHHNAVFDIAWAKVRYRGCGSAHWAGGRRAGGRCGSEECVLLPVLIPAGPAIKRMGRWPLRPECICSLTMPQDDTRMLAASGDQTISLWDTGRADLLGAFRSHTGSVKSVCPQPGCNDVFASGGRTAQGVV